MEPPNSLLPQETLKTASVVSTLKSGSVQTSQTKSPMQSTSKDALKVTDASRTTETQKNKKAIKRDRTKHKALKTKEKTTEVATVTVTSNTLSAAKVVNPGLMPPAQILETPERRRQSPDVSSCSTAHGKKQVRPVPFRDQALTERPSRPILVSSGSEEEPDIVPPKRRRTRSRSPSFASRLSRANYEYEYYRRPVGTDSCASPEFRNREQYLREGYAYTWSPYDPRYRRSPPDHFFTESYRDREWERSRPLTPPRENETLSRYRQFPWPPTRPYREDQYHHRDRSSPPRIFRDRSPSLVPLRDHRPHRDRTPPTCTITRPSSVSPRRQEPNESPTRPAVLTPSTTQSVLSTPTTTTT